MTELLQVGANNALVALGVGLVAAAAQRAGARARVVHLLWLGVLLALLTPPLLALPLVSLPGITRPALASWTDLGPLPTLHETLGELDVAPAASAEVDAARLALVVWALGAALVLAVSAARVVRFHRALRGAARPAPSEVQALTAALAVELGLRRVPAVFATPGRISPLLWWAGGRPAVFVPAALLGAPTLRWALAHELAHLRRRDHLVRWLEWVASVAFWWNPVTWWARRGLRDHEELCCDGLVLTALRPAPKAYATALLDVAAFLSDPPPARAPAMACALTGGETLERRLRMIVSGQLNVPAPSRWLRAGLLLVALGVLPLGIVRAQDGEPEAKPQADAPADPEAELETVRQKLADAVAAGQLTAEEAAAKLEAWRAHRGAGAHRATVEQRFAKLGVDADGLARIRHALGEHGIVADQLEPALGALLHLVQVRLKGVEADAKLFAHLEQLGLSAAQVEALSRVAERLAGHVEQRHAKEHAVDRRIDHHLRQQGFSEAQARESLGAVRKLAHVIQQHGADAALGESWQAWIREQGLSDEQVATLRQLASRLAARGPADRGAKIAEAYRELGVSEAQLARIKDELTAAGVDDASLVGVLSGLLHVVHGVREQGDGYAMPAKLRQHLEQLGLNDRGFETLLDLGRRLANPL